MNKIEIIDRASSIKYNKSRIKIFCNKILKKIEAKNWEFTILFSDNSFIECLNEKYRNKKGPTDILTFCESDISDGWDWTNCNDRLIYKGDIVISIDMLKKNATDFNVNEEEELKRLIIHGILHLNGMQHSSNSIEDEMIGLQEKYLIDFGEYKF